MGIEENFPLEQLTPIAKAEASSRQNYRPIYSLHKWWAQRLGSVFRTIGLSTFLNTDDPNEVWDHYFKSNDFSDKIVLDPFMGSGTTLVELNRLGAKTIGIDINPVAWWTVKKELEPVDTNELEKAFKTLERNVADKIKQYYKTECPACHREADVMYYFWVRKVKCVSCGKDVHLFKYYVIAREKEKHPAVVVCPDCWHIFETRSSRETAMCPKCSFEFDPDEGTFEGGNYTCPSCKQGYNVLKTVQRGDSPPECDMYAIEYYCPVCKRRGYKEPGADDLKLYEDVRREFEECKTKLIFPEQSVPIGEKTKELLNFNFKTFNSLFNERQILCFSNLLSEIRKIDNKKIRELLITSFSSSLEYHNMLCQYNYGYNKIVNSFNYHAYPITMIPVENNVWGAKIGAGTFISYLKRLLKAKQYCNAPFEKYRNKGKVIELKIPGEKINGEFAENFDELKNGTKNSMVLCRTSENMEFIPDKSIDAVITDPPYYSNVMYSELADFFYSWLREALKDGYEEFKPELSPKANEIVKNKVQGKDDDFFIEGITRVFKECCRVLKDDAPMIFTYHHRQSQAWAVILEAILKAGFYVSAEYPVTSDPSFNPHIKGKDSIDYDAIIICRKRTEEKRTTFENYEEELYINAKKIIENERKKRPHLSKGDISVVVFGKCLEIYSKYYPNITSDGAPISVDTATDKVWEIIEQLSETDYLPPELDSITRAFTLNLFEPGGISYNELNKRLRQRGIDISELDAEQLISGPKNAKGPADPFSRKAYIEGKLSKDGEILDIDKVQYLFILYTTDKNPSEWLRKWKTPELEQLCKILAEKTGDSRYANVMELTLDMF